MSQPGDQTRALVTAERIRLAPRPVRPAFEPGDDGLVLPEPEPEPEPVEFLLEEAPIFRPDRSRMDPLSLDRSATRKLEKLFEEQHEARLRDSSARTDRLLLRTASGVLPRASQMRR